METKNKKIKIGKISSSAINMSYYKLYYNLKYRNAFRKQQYVLTKNKHVILQYIGGISFKKKEYKLLYLYTKCSTKVSI